MRHTASLSVGPASFRIGSAWAQPIAQLRALYAGCPAAPVPARFTVRLEPDRPWRRHLRPSIHVTGDHHLPGAEPLALAHGLLAAEMGMNLQMALGWRDHLLLHAAWVTRGERAVVLTGQSGSGKSTLSARLAGRGWRFGADEFALLGADGALAPFPRPISLKNEAIADLANPWPGARFGPTLTGTPKGTVRHLAPPAEAVRRAAETARPALLLFPTHGQATAIRPVGRDEAFVRLTQASTNYVALGRVGFDTLTRFVTDTPAWAIDYPDGPSGVDAVESLMATL